MITSFSIESFEAAFRDNEAWLQTRIAELPARVQTVGARALPPLATELVQLLIARPARVSASVAPIAASVDASIRELVAQSGAGPMSWSKLPVLDVFAALAATGAAVAIPARADAGAILGAIVTARDERPVSHWHRGFIALALDVPAVYRGIAGFEMHEPIPFTPGATFGPNLQGFLGHLAGAVESGAPLDACLSAWRDLAAYSFPLMQAHAFRDSFFLWGAWILQHRIAKAPLAGVAQWLHDSLYSLARASS